MTESSTGHRPDEMTQTKRGPAATGSEALLHALERGGVDVVFGLPGDSVLALYDALTRSPLRHVLVRHEQGAGHAAEGHARATGGVGVCLVSAGPAATNLVTPLANAYRDATPIVAVTGQVKSSLLGTSAYQEIDICDVARPVTKLALQVTRVDRIAPAITTALRTAAEGRPGPVLVDITQDALEDTVNVDVDAAVDAAVASARPTAPATPTPERVGAAARLLRAARRPVLYVGGGAVTSSAGAEVRALAELLAAPVVTTLMARGAVPDGHPLCLGMPGVHGAAAAVLALQRSDLILAVGARFADRVTGEPETFAPEAGVVHIDIDPLEIGKLRRADVPLPGDARPVLAALVAELHGHDGGTRTSQWWDLIDAWRAHYARPVTGDSPSGTVSPRLVLRELSELSPEGTVFSTGVGQHQMWAAQTLSVDNPRRWLTSGGAGTMGYGIPAAMGAKVAVPSSVVWAIDGDGCFQMTGQELITCASEGINIKVAVLNNAAHGMARQFQNLFFDKNFAHSTLSHGLPDVAAMAKAMGCVGLRCSAPGDVRPTLERALAIDDAPVVVDFVIDADEMVWPTLTENAPFEESFPDAREN